MKFFLAHFEKLILAIIFCFFLLISNVVLDKISKLPELDAGKVGHTRGREIELVKTEQFNALALLNNQQKLVWNKESEGADNLFRLTGYMWCKNPTCNAWIRTDRKQCPVCGTEQADQKRSEQPNEKTIVDEDRDADGLPNTVEEQYDFLDPDNPADAYEDQDQDWFVNVIEFYDERGEMDNPRKHPYLATRLQLIDVVQAPFPVILKNVTVPDKAKGNKKKWDLQFNVQSKSLFLNLGDTLLQGAYTIKDINRKTRKRVIAPGMPPVTEQLGVVTLEDKEGMEITLVKNEQAYVGRELRFKFYPQPVHKPETVQMLEIEEDETLKLRDSRQKVETYRYVPQGKITDAVTIVFVPPKGTDMEQPPQFAVSKQPEFIKRSREFRRIMNADSPSTGDTNESDFMENAPRFDF